MHDLPADTDLEVRQLKERVRLLEATLRHGRDLLFTLDADGRIVAISDFVEKALGYAEADLLGLPFNALVRPSESHSPSPQQSSLRTKSGECFPVEMHTDRRMVIALSLADRQALEEGARQAQRMETLGLLAGGIAHDFNNLLTGILGYAYLLQNDPMMPGQHSEALEVIVTASERAAQLTTQLLGFVRGKKAHTAPVDLHQIIQDLVELLGRTVDKKVSISANLAAAEMSVLGDACQMYQVLLNLCLNARDAMPEGGKLSIATKNAGGSIVISVSDTGTGIPREIRAHIFDALFTTKDTGRGTGMGLATVRAIVRNHGGAINVESETGKGATFHVTLPAQAPTLTAMGTFRREPQRGAGHILVIEDEPVVRQVLQHMLSGLGYSPVCPVDVPSGIDYFRHHSLDIDAVILDMVMPAMNGLEVLETLRAIDPDVKAILTTGSGNDSIDGVEYLPKPYQPEQLAEVIRRALHNSIAAKTRIA